MSRQYFGDPDGAFLRKQSDDYYAEESCPVCDKCKEHITDDDCYDVDGFTYCEDCFHEKFRMEDDELPENGEVLCEDCQKNLAGEWDLDAHKFDGFCLCGECADKWYRVKTASLIYGIA